jgi:hypothetical protein
MNYVNTSFDADAACGFAASAKERLAHSYPDKPARLTHNLARHPMLEPEALISLAARMRSKDVQCYRGDVPVANESGGHPSNGLTVAETVRNIASNKSWMVMKKIEQDPDYAALLDSLLAELEEVAIPVTGPMVHRQAFIFVSSPGSITPFHFDPEHNILLQIAGEKTMHLFSQDDEELAPCEAHEAFHAKGHYTLEWKDEYADRAMPQLLAPGDALYVPVKAPHFVRNGAEPSISLSITWRSAWSFEESDAHLCNAMLRRLGIEPNRPHAWPSRNWAKASAYRVMRRIPGLC